MWGCFGSLGIQGYEKMKLPTSSQETVLFKSLSDLNWPLGVSKQCKKKDETLDIQSACGNVPGSYHYSETDFKTDFRP
jgi:hypothetical protein